MHIFKVTFSQFAQLFIYTITDMSSMTFENGKCLYAVLKKKGEAEGELSVKNIKTKYQSVLGIFPHLHDRWPCEKLKV